MSTITLKVKAGCTLSQRQCELHHVSIMCQSALSASDVIRAARTGYSRNAPPQNAHQLLRTPAAFVPRRLFSVITCVGPIECRERL
jgi:hypothetical protein